MGCRIEPHHFLVVECPIGARLFFLDLSSRSPGSKAAVLRPAPAPLAFRPAGYGLPVRRPGGEHMEGFPMEFLDVLNCDRLI